MKKLECFCGSVSEVSEAVDRSHMTALMWWEDHRQLSFFIWMSSWHGDKACQLVSLWLSEHFTLAMTAHTAVHTLHMLSLASWTCQSKTSIGLVCLWLVFDFSLKELEFSQILQVFLLQFGLMWAFTFLVIFCCSLLHYCLVYLYWKKEIKRKFVR